MGAYSQLHPARKGVAITPSDTVNLSGAPVAIYVGVSGDIVFVGEDDAAVTLKAVPVGLIWIAPKRINTTSTTATNMVALY